ncbi:hypothetical protein Kpol_1036p86 [Vanderwaltozyma polyspora DSM 70294]|uniref:Diphthine--ammonia ligase n=1 Tax=Vanderwaltozyma polyspora (strain ATCC 22028 / DSM 70294 / BCRC 21397 / CBS 2163 / NBRC 10782 / NRRL Y-8283 / UCD 57-17) TaxID=436907 RepID=A7TEN2_VANPO|nr:uncharacterized protein Kpol_1036p86 [Vanderwaltozyma polyspora DSM 70294]EDO19339.1 hypothetical protein Kpol_1036p86 [Vanderwaltozyma polyspora DSM 70294]
MKFVALVSGGKDSCYNVLHCIKNGHELVALANLHPEDTNEQELDSFMFQTVGHDVVSYYDQCTGLPLFRHSIKLQGSKNVNLNYVKTENDEIEDLLELLLEVKDAIPDLEAVSVGAILSSYQRTRVEDVCSRIGLTVLSYLWQRDQLELMTEMCLASKTKDDTTANMDARLIKLAAIGLDETHLFKSLPEAFPTLKKLNSMYDVHICGEGGEFETMVLDAPFFHKGLLEIKSKKINSSDRSCGVYNGRLEVSFKERPLTKEDSETLINSLITPPYLPDMWQELIEAVTIEVTNTTSCPKKDSVNIVEPVKLNVKASTNILNGLLYISNLFPQNIEEDIERQVENVFNQLDSILGEKTYSRAQVLNSSLYLFNMSDFSKVNKIYNNYFDIQKFGPLPPSRACVGSKELPEGCLLQLSVIVDASCDITTLPNGIKVNNNKDGLHVQGRSYWAPCNIGPYSQAIWKSTDRNKVSYISGQIALDPASMEMNFHDPLHQSVLSLKHFDTLKNTIDAKRSLSMTCFISEKSIVPVITSTWSLYCSDMAYESELWMSKEDDPKGCLIIAEVSELPRNALCEWGGISCNTATIEDDIDDIDDIETGTEYLSLKNEILSVATSHTKVITNEHRRTFVTIFLDSDDEVITLLSSGGMKCQASLYCHPSSISRIASSLLKLNGVNLNFVTAVYNYKGKEHKFGIHLIM